MDLRASHHEVSCHRWPGYGEITGVEQPSRSSLSSFWNVRVPWMFSWEVAMPLAFASPDREEQCPWPEGHNPTIQHGLSSQVFIGHFFYKHFYTVSFPLGSSVVSQITNFHTNQIEVLPNEDLASGADLVLPKGMRAHRKWEVRMGAALPCPLPFTDHDSYARASITFPFFSSFCLLYFWTLLQLLYKVPQFIRKNNLRCFYIFIS